MDVITNACGSLMASSIIAVVENLRDLQEWDSFAELQKWETWLVHIEGLLKDAEERQTTDPRVKVWLDRLRDLAYDIEDVLDEFSTEALKRRVTKEDSYWSSLSTALSPDALAFNHKMASKMKDIAERLEVISAQEQTLDLKRTAGEGSNKQKERRKATSLVDESDICGRKHDRKALVQMLQSPGGSSKSSKPFSVICILGMGGIGKTTLAQLVYKEYNWNAAQLVYEYNGNGYFDVKGWVCVSENFDVEMLTREILKSITGKPCEDLNLNLHQEKLKELLSRKKFLLFLDDLWEVDCSKWDDLCKPFSDGAPGSKIVITTRKDGVASMALDVLTYRVEALPDAECLSLLAINALGAKNFDSHFNLKDIALEMVERCKGLPLAAKVLGGLLRNKESPRYWKGVLRSNTWKLPEKSSSTLAVLKLSYDDLPSHLKRCFVYSAIFPKDYEFDRDELVLLWMAEGFLQFPEGEKRMEDLGIQYFDDLVSRSLFQPSRVSWKNQQKYVMHDLIHDLAQSMAGEFCYNYEKKINFNGEQSNLKLKKVLVRHASIRSPEDDDSQQEYTILTLMNSLRTILCFPNQSYYLSPEYFVSYVSREGHVYAERFSTLVIGSKCLRVLSLTSSWIKSLPDSIGDLKHLRHLNLSCTSIERLPDSVSSLFNLLTLLLRSCELLEKLPDKIGNLVNLRHLDISNTPKLQEIPRSIGMLTNLQTLSKFVVNESHGTTIAVLKELNNLRRILSIEALHNMTNLQDAMSANLEGKQGLEELVFKWNCNQQGLESLKPPHQNLKRLTIDSYGGSEFPSWVSDLSFSKLVSLNLSSCEKIKFLPASHNLRHLCKLEISKCSNLVSFAPVGCPSLLEDLEIFDCASLKDFGVDFRLPTSLKVFRIKDCPSLLSLPNGLMTLDDNTNPCQSHLKNLSIIRCEQLTSLPCGKFSATLETLEIRGCSSLASLAVVGIPSRLEDLEISGCASLKDFGADFRLPTSLKAFKIKDCPSLLSLPDGLMMLDDNANLCQSHLKNLSIIRCKQLTSLPRGKLPATLETLKIARCSSLVSLALVGLPSRLEKLEIFRCPSLKDFGADFKLPTSLKSFIVRDCPRLSSLPDGLMTLDDNTYPCQSHLKKLSIVRCEQLTSLPRGKLPATLETLEIGGYEQMKILVSGVMLCNNITLEIYEDDEIREFPSIDNLQSLTDLAIFRCSTLESFQEMSLCNLALQSLRIQSCQNLSSLPNQMYSYFPSLRTLHVSDCPLLVSLTQEGGGLPKNLTSLEISRCEKLRWSIAEWRLHLLSSLDTLRVESICPAVSDLVLFPEDACHLLPTSLRTLKIGHFEHMESLGSGLRRLTHLEDLTIEDCPKLRTAEVEDLPTHQTLEALTSAIYTILIPFSYIQKARPGFIFLIVASDERPNSESCSIF